MRLCIRLKLSNFLIIHNRLTNTWRISPERFTVFLTWYVTDTKIQV